MRGRLRPSDGWAASAVVLRGGILIAPVAALLLAAPAGTAPPPSVVAVVVAFSLGFARAPESGFGLLALGSVVGWWCVVADDGLHPSVLVAAVLLLAAHVAGLVAAYGPPGARVDPRVAAVWVARAGLVALAAPAVWLVTRLAGDLSSDEGLWQEGLWQAGLLVAGLVLVAALATLGARRPVVRG